MGAGVSSTLVFPLAVRGGAVMNLRAVDLSFLEEGLGVHLRLQALSTGVVAKGKAMAPWVIS